jgi:hypothetical protein
MDVLMELDDGHIEGALGKEFVTRGLCPELSLGYNVTMSKSPAGFLRATNKRVVELSIVRQGARDGCKIRAFTQGAAGKALGMAGKMFSLPGSSSHSQQDSKKRPPPSDRAKSAKRHKILV